MQEIIALRLVEALEKMAQQSQQSAVIPELLKSRFEEMRRHLPPGEVLPPPTENENK
jgi:hypothetical protein